MIKLDNDLLAQLGLGNLPPEEKKKMLAHIYETLEMRVGVKLAEQMTDAQLDEFEQFINRNDEAGALQWLESNFPNYKDVVASEFEKLKAEVAQVAPQIIAAASQVPQQPQMGAPAPMQQPYGPQSMQQPMPPQYMQAPMPQQQYTQPQPMPPQAPAAPMAPIANDLPPEQLRQQPQMNPVAPAQPWTPQQAAPGQPWQAQQPPMPPSQQPTPQPNPTQNPTQDVRDDYGLAA